MNRADIKADVVSRILDALESGQLFWRKPWTVHPNAGPLACSLSSRTPYRGINQLLLMCCRWKFNYQSRWFGTYQQVKQLGGSVNKGEKATRVILYKPVTKKQKDENGDEQESKFALMKTFCVFNAEQTTLTNFQVNEPEESDNVFEKHEAAEQLIASVPCTVKTGQSAHYCPTTDEITLPPRHRFETPEAYYETAFHEMAHWAESRTGFDRKIAENSYGYGELVAELTAVNIMAHLQLATPQTTLNSAAYLQHWISNIRKDHSVIFKAASQAAKATDYLMAFAPQADAVPTVGTEATPAIAVS